jgi:hypothetical protein
MKKTTKSPKKTFIAPIRCTEAQKVQIRKNAKKAGKPIATFLRELGLAAS